MEFSFNQNAIKLENVINLIATWAICLYRKQHFLQNTILFKEK